MHRRAGSPPRLRGARLTRSLVAAGAVVAFSATGCGSTPGPVVPRATPVVAVDSVPAPIAGRGYRRVFRSDFRTLDRKIWDDHIWYDGAPSRGWRRFQTVAKGVVTLRTSRRFARPDGTWPLNTITTLGSRHSFLRGYFEARLRWMKGNGAWPGFWLMSYRHATNPAWPAVNPYCRRQGLAVARCWSSELDVFEGQGNDPRGFYGTLHRNSCSCYGVSDAQNGENYRRFTQDLAGGWHTYSALWTRSRITWYVDRQPVLSAPVFDSTNQPMFLLLQMWTGGWSGSPDGSTPDFLATQVDYVRVWQRRATGSGSHLVTG
jgi:beta-glucanase (GH16 family)